jgi:microcystin-dependent protein
MSHLLDEILSEASNGSPATVALSSESVAVLLFASKFLEEFNNWLDRAYDPLDEITTSEWDQIEKLVGNAYTEIMTPVLVTGTMAMWLTGTPPDRWLILDGTAVSRDDYSELFDLWGVTFGNGDGSTTFNLPDMRSLHPKGAGGVIGLGAVNGASSIHLTTGQLPAHNHGVNDPGHTHTKTLRSSGTAGGSVNHVAAPTTTTLSSNWVTDSAVTGITTQNAGLGDAVDIKQPSMGVNYIVYAGQS